MKILALGDPHGKLPKNLDNIIRKNKIDIIVCVGDIAFSPKKPWLEKSWKGISNRFMNKNYRNIVDKLCSYKLPVLTLRGNMLMVGKRKKIVDKILRKHKNLINKFTGRYKFQNQNFIFFDISFELSTLMEHEKKKSFFKNKARKDERREKRLNKLLREKKNAILICHNPPYGIVDKAFNGKHVGSKILLKAIKTYQPRLVLCGHIHEAKGEEKIGKTKIYNLGWQGDYKIIEI